MAVTVAMMFVVLMVLMVFVVLMMLMVRLLVDVLVHGRMVDRFLLDVHAKLVGGSQGLAAMLLLKLLQLGKMNRHLRHRNLDWLLHNNLLVDWNFVVHWVGLWNMHHLRDAHGNMLGHLVGHRNAIGLVNWDVLVDRIRVVLDHRHWYRNRVRFWNWNRFMHTDFLRHRNDLLDRLVNGHLDADVHRMRNGHSLGHRDDLGNGNYFGHWYGFGYMHGLVDNLNNGRLVVFLMVLVMLVVVVVVFVG